MSLIQEVQELKNEYKQAQKETEKATREAERLERELEKAREQKQQKREYERDLKKAVEKDLRNTFGKCFDRDGLEKGYINLCLKTTRDEILKNVAESTIESEYIDKIYETTLNKVKRIYENDKNAKEEYTKIKLQETLSSQLEQIEIKKEKHEKQEKKINLFNNLIKIFFILFNPITIILYLIIAGYFFIAKPVFQEANDLGYDKFETVWKNPETNEKLPKNKLQII